MGGGGGFHFAMTLMSSYSTLKRIKKTRRDICIEGKSGENEIAIYWKDYFCKLLNTNKINEALKSSILDKLEGIQYTDSMSVSTVEVSDTISTL